MPSKDIRTIIRAGNAYAVILPRAWLRYFELEPGDKVEVITNGSVTIKPIKKKS